MCILVTGFGRFPGVHDNPAEALIRALGAYRARLARLGIALELSVLPVEYAGVARRLEELNETLKPDAILHFGLAARRKVFSIETRALNRLGQLHYDAADACAPRRAIIPGGAPIVRSTFPAREIESGLRRAGLRSRLSIHAGSYVCNEALYLSLACSKARAIGFIHVPRLRRKDLPIAARRNRRPDLADMTGAALIAILASARKLRRDDARTARAGRPDKILEKGHAPPLLRLA